MKRFLLVLLFACSIEAFSQKAAIAPPPPAPRKPVTEEIQGVKITDDYRWLEDNNAPEVKAWVAAEDQRARSHLQALPEHAQILEWLKKLAKTRSAAYFGLR